MLLLVIDVAGSLLIPTLAAQMLNLGISAHSFQKLIEIGLWMAAASLVSGICAILGGYACAALSARVGQDMRVAVYDKSLKLTMPHGYDTVLSGDGSALSQGQRQLISIARAALANAPVLILDEATSSIDSRTEKIVQDGMDKLMKGRTTFVIAHRLSTIKNSDVIMVLDQGRIIERGNHESLLAKKGIYYQLYTGALEMD